MTVRNFVFREIWVKSQVTSINISFFVISDRKNTEIVVTEDPNIEFLKHFDFQ